MKKEKPSSECQTLIDGFNSCGTNILEFLDQQQIERYVGLCQRYAFSQLQYYRYLVAALDDTEFTECKSLYNRLSSVKITLSKDDVQVKNIIDNSFRLLWRWKPCSFTLIKHWYGDVEAVFKSTPASLPEPWPGPDQMIVPEPLYTVGKAAWGWRLEGRPLVCRLPDGRKLTIMAPDEFLARKLVSLFVFQSGRLGPAPGWEGDIPICILLLDARGAFVQARLVEEYFHITTHQTIMDPDANIREAAVKALQKFSAEH
jgi:hypothetical protein